MLKISRLADYGILIMLCFEEENRLLSSTAIAEKTHLPLTTVSKVLKALTERKLLESYKGASGGYQLSKSMKQINLAEVIEAIDGPVALTDCNHQEKQCAQANNCVAKDNWHIINDVIFETLKSLSIQDMSKPLRGLKVELKPVIKLNVEHHD